MFKIVMALVMLSATPALAVDFMAGAGLDFQYSSSDLSPQGSYNTPDSDLTVGGAAAGYARFNVNERFGLRTGAELVSRFIKQDYNFWIFSAGNGTTRYDVLSVDIPLYFEIYLGSSGKHTLYVGPKVAFNIYDHCSNESLSSSAYPCQPDAVKNIFALVQLGYMLRLSEIFGLTFFLEDSVTHIVDKGAITADLLRTGVQATFYF